MTYNILEAKIEFKHGKLDRITVLIDCTATGSKPLTDVRAIFADTKPRGGYMSIRPDGDINTEVLQQIAGYGCETMDRDEIFPNWKK